MIPLQTNSLRGNALRMPYPMPGGLGPVLAEPPGMVSRRGRLEREGTSLMDPHPPHHSLA
jgi:hypothetical protein